jgi:hypothetical protein
MLAMTTFYFILLIIIFYLIENNIKEKMKLGLDLGIIIRLIYNQIIFL